MQRYLRFALLIHAQSTADVTIQTTVAQLLTATCIICSRMLKMRSMFAPFWQINASEKRERTCHFGDSRLRVPSHGVFAYLFAGWRTRTEKTRISLLIRRKYIRPSLSLFISSFFFPSPLWNVALNLSPSYTSCIIPVFKARFVVFLNRCRNDDTVAEIIAGRLPKNNLYLFLLSIIFFSTCKIIFLVLFYNLGKLFSWKCN